VRAIVDVFVQLGQDKGARLVTEIKFRRAHDTAASLKI
jgi:hypothetical protein